NQYSCARGIFMVGPNVSQAPYLTMAQPPGLMTTVQPGALYYIDTSTGSQQSIDCVTNRPAAMFPAPFSANTSYVIYNLFAKNDAVVSYQLFVGDGVNSLDVVQGKFVRVLPHLHGTGFGKKGTVDAFASQVNMSTRSACTPGTSWCKDMPIPTVQNGILT